MLLFVGLGNPTPDSENNRHNVGFKIIDSINKKFGLSKQKPKFKGLLTTGDIEGEKVYAIAAPHSIFSPGNALLFDGYFTGYDMTENAFYTIPTKPGSSGAGVINDEGELIAIIHSAPGSFENLAIASSLKNVKHFLSINLSRKNKF